MTQKRVSPLNNPPSEKDVAVADSRTKRIIKPFDSDGKGDVGGFPRGAKRVVPVEAVVRCQMCRQQQKIVFAYGRPPQWHRCIRCGELQPMDGYRVSMYGSGLPTVFSPAEIAWCTRAHQLEKKEV